MLRLLKRPAAVLVLLWPLSFAPGMPAQAQSASRGSTEQVGPDGTGRAALPGSIDPASFGAACSGADHARQDTEAFLAAIAAARRQHGGTVMVPDKTCYLAAPLVLPQGVNLVGQGAGSALVPASPMDDMIVLKGSLSSVRQLQLADLDGLARNGIAFDAPGDALPTTIEHTLMTRFPGAAIHVEAGQALQVRANAFLSNGVAVASNNDGISMLVEGNYSAGGNGFLFQKTHGQGPEGSIVRDNVVFAKGTEGFALKIAAGLDILISGNMFEGGGAAAEIGAETGTISGIRSNGNWYGANDKLKGAGVALRLANSVYGFTSVGDIFEGRGQTGVDCTAETEVRSNLNVTFLAPLFLKYSPAAVDMHFHDTLGIAVAHAQFSGQKSIVEDGAVSGRVDFGTFSAIPQRRSLVYGRQTFGLKMISTGSVRLPPGATSVRFPHGTDFVPLPGEVSLTLAALPLHETGLPMVSDCDRKTCLMSVRHEPGGAGALFGFKVDVSG